MEEIINKKVQLRGINIVGKKRAYDFVISSEKVDQHKTVFLKSGWQLDRYKKNPIVTYNHNSNSENPDNIIGTSEVFFDGKLLVGRVVFEQKDVNPLAEKVRLKIEAGTFRMASVSAAPLKYRFGDISNGEDPEVIYFTKQELIEWSIVPIGSNQDAFKRNNKCISNIRVDLLLNRRKKITVQEAQLIINNNKI